MNKFDLFPGGGKYCGLYEIDFGIKPTDKVLDVGGGNNPYPQSTHVIDFKNNSQQRHYQSLKIGNRQMKILLLSLLFLPGCSAVSVCLTPYEVKYWVHQGAEVARMSVEDPPNEEYLEQYLEANKQLWESLEEYFEARDL